MSVSNLHKYSRYVLITALIFYLLLTWLYFKDNVASLTAQGLLLWFIFIPFLLVIILVLMIWRQKRSLSKSSKTTVQVDQLSSEPFNDTYSIFVRSSLCLPEGESWSEVIDNNSDLTVLSTSLMDADNLPILTKPIANLIDEPELIQALIDTNDSNKSNESVKDRVNNYVDDDRTDDKYADIENFENMQPFIDPLTLRLSTLIYHHLAANDDVLALLGNYFDAIVDNTADEPNSAVNAHPDWQQHYIVSANNEQKLIDGTLTISDKKLEQITLYICLPTLANSASIKRLVSQVLLDYGIAQQHLLIKIIKSADFDNADSVNIAPYQFVNDQIKTLPKNTMPEVCLLLLADSQMNEDWLESTQHKGTADSVIPTEMCSLFIFSNEAAQTLLNISDSVKVLFTDIDDLSSKSADAGVENDTTHGNRRYYRTNLKRIEKLLLSNSLVMTPTRETKTSHPTANNQSSKHSKDEQKIFNDSFSKNTIYFLSDINPSKKPYDLSEFLFFLDAFTQKGATVIDHHLGHYSSENTWFKSMTSLALFINLSKESKQQSEHVFFIQDCEPCCLLWSLNHANE